MAAATLPTTSVGHQRRHSFPSLSPSFRSHQLWTPLYLDRITICDPYYQDYLQRNVQIEQPHLNHISRRVQKYGDNYFFLQKDIPVEQLYNRTALKRSDVRPWDELVPRPLTTHEVLNKESHLPYPKGHPFSSHISQFAVFPNTRSDNRAVDLADEEVNNLPPPVILKDSSAQTEQQYTQQPLNVGKPFRTVIQQKAFSEGMRVEELFPHTHSHSETTSKPGVYWHVPRTARHAVHQRSLTYPAPSTMFSLTADKNLLRPLTVNTHEALLTANHRTAHSTTYHDQFPPLSGYNSQLATPTMSRCTSVDYRGKYSRGISFSYSLPPQQQAPQPESTGSIPHRTLYQQLLATSREHQNTAQPHAQQVQEPVTTEKIYVDQATQTEEWLYGEEMQDEEAENTAQEEKKFQFGFPASVIGNEPMEVLRPFSMESFLRSEISRPPSAPAACNVPLPITTRPFSRSNAQRNFHCNHPEPVPDLRELSIRTGKRHTFSGYHAHYWH